MSARTADTVRRFHRLAWSDGDLTAARPLLADDLVDHNHQPRDRERRPHRRVRHAEDLLGLMRQLGALSG